MTIRRTLDAAMILLLPLLMAYSLVGELFHEIAGVAMLGLFIAHHVLNRGWWKGLTQGRYTPERVFRTTLDFLLLAFMILQPLSGILLSKHLFVYLPAVGFTSLLRQVHLLLAYWGFVLMSVHTGTHADAMLAPLKRCFPKSARVAIGTLGLIAVYGVCAFFKRQIPGYLFGQIPFAFFDFSEPRGFFFGDYFAMIALFAAIGDGIVLGVRKIRKRETVPS